MFTSTYEMEILAKMKHDELVHDAENTWYRGEQKTIRRNQHKILRSANAEPRVLRASGLHNSVLF